MSVTPSEVENLAMGGEGPSPHLEGECIMVTSFDRNGVDVVGKRKLGKE